MKKIKYLLIPTLLFSTIFLACQSSNSTHNNKTQQIEKENEQLKKENEQLKKEQSQNNISNSENSTSNTTSTSTKENDLSFLKSYNGKYTFDVNLFDKKQFTNRLKKLLGDDRYDFLYTTWSVETPMTYENDVFSASACEQHNCPATNFIIVMDFNTNVMHCGIREEFKVKTYSEDGSTHTLVQKWKNEY